MSTKISITADITLTTLRDFDEPASLLEIARSTGNARRDDLVKHQVRPAIQDHLLPRGYVNEYHEERKGNEVAVYTLTDKGSARAQPPRSELKNRLETLEERLTVAENFLHKVEEAVPDAHNRISKLARALDDESEGSYEEKVESDWSG